MALISLGASPSTSHALQAQPRADLAGRLDSYFAPLTAAGEFGGVVLVGGADSVLALRSYGLADHERDLLMTLDTRFRIASLTKTFTAAAVLVLSDRGVLELDDSLGRWIPGFPRGDRITVRHLLGHESGVGEPERPEEVADLDELVEAIAAAPPLFEPGAESRYSNAGYALLARVVERASGTDFDDFLAATFFRPLGMTDTGGYDHRQDVPGGATGYLPGPAPAGVVRAPRPHSPAAIGNGHLWSTAPDLWHWARAVDAGAIFDVDAEDWPYGWGKIRDAGREGVQQTGLTDGYTASLALHRASDTYVVVLGNVMNAEWTRWAGDASKIAFGETVPPTLPPAAAVTDPARLRAYAGTYDPVAPGPPAVEIVVRDGHAWLQWERQPPGFYLSPVSDSEFVVRGECGRVRFIEDAAAALRWSCGEGVTEFRPRGAGARAADTLLIRNVHVVPMTRDTVLRDHGVRIVGGVIDRIAVAGEFAPGPGVTVVDGGGGYLVPGLVDAHVHLNDERELLSYLVHGVTTVVNLRGSPAHLELARSMATGETIGPRILTSGPLIDGSPPIWDPPGTTVVTNPAEARAAVAAQADAGYDLVKVYNNLDPASLAAAVVEADAHGLAVVGHLPGIRIALPRSRRRSTPESR